MPPLHPPSLLVYVLTALTGCVDKSPSADSGSIPTAGDGGSTTDAGTSDGGAVGGSIAVDAGDAMLTADGRSALLLTLTVTDAAGQPVTSGTDVGLTTSLGSLGTVEWSDDGAATVAFVSGTWPESASLAADEGWALSGDTAIQLVEGGGVAVQMHTHSSFSEGSGTLRSHTAMLKEIGLDGIWWTDHDYRYNPDGYYEIGGMGFETAIPVYKGIEAGWLTLLETLRVAVFETTAGAMHDGDLGLRIAVQARDDVPETAPEQAVWEFRSQEKANYKVLMAQQSISFWIRPQESSVDAELLVSVPLSRMSGDRAEDEYRTIVFVHSSRSYESDEWTLYVPMAVVDGEWTQVEGDLTALAIEHFGADAVDLHGEFVTFTARAWDGAQATWHIDTMAFDQEIYGTDLRDLQRSFLDDLSSRDEYAGIKHYIGAELSHVTDAHASAFYPDEDWAFVAYTAPASVLLDTAAQDVKDAGGVVAWNHLFGTLSTVLSEEDRQEAINNAIEDFGEHRMMGCELLEVGYRTRGGQLDDFMAVWDGVALEHGLFVTGIGTSDQHHLSLGFAGNDFVSWVGAASDDATDMVEDLRRGMVWFGDPDHFEGADVAVSVQVPTSQAVMGQVIVGATATQEVDFAATPLQAGWEVRTIVDGEVSASSEVAVEGAFELSTVVDPSSVTLVRFEVHHPEDGAILYSNPVYFVADGTDVAAVRSVSP